MDSASSNEWGGRRQAGVGVRHEGTTPVAQLLSSKYSAGGTANVSNPGVSYPWALYRLANRTGRNSYMLLSSPPIAALLPVDLLDLVARSSRSYVETRLRLYMY